MKESKRLVQNTESFPSRKKEVLKKGVLDYIYEYLEQNEEPWVSEAFEKSLYKKFPNNSEEIKTLLGFESFLSTQSSFISDRELNRKRDEEKIVDVAEYQILLIHFIRLTKDRGYLQKMWNYFERIAEYMSYEEQAHYEEEVKRYLPVMKAGILGQVALEKLFDDARIPFNTATPAEDVYKKIDLWTRSGKTPLALQIKTYRRFGNLEIVKDPDELPIPDLSTKTTGSAEIHFFNKLYKDINKFRLRVKEYAWDLGHPVEAYAVVMPGGEIDPVTGEPSENLKKQFQEKIKKIIKKR